MLPTNLWAQETELLESLMQHKVNNILLIASLFDSFVFEVDGLLSDRITEYFRLLNLDTQPNVFHSSSLESAHNLLTLERIDIIIIHLSSMRSIALELMEIVKKDYPDLPVYFLLGAPQDLMFVENHIEELQEVQDFFYWTGDSKLFLAIIKLCEETFNIFYDIQVCNIPIIMVVETFIPYYSQFLPVLYEQIIQLSLHLIHQEHQSQFNSLYLNARPRIVLFHDYELALNFYNQYQQSIIGIISNINYNYLGNYQPNAGLQLLQNIRAHNPTLPFLMQSFDPEYRDIVSSSGGEFLMKDLSGIRAQMRKWLENDIGFGKFIFRQPNGEKLDEASTLIGFYHSLQNLPLPALMYHLQTRQINSWLAAHAEIALSNYINNISLNQDPIEIKHKITEALFSLISFRRREKIQEYNEESDFELNFIYKIGADSIGGKGRGLAFLNVAINRYSTIAEKYPSVNISVPVAAVLATSIFDEFITINPRLNDIDSLEQLSDNEIDQLFLQSELPSECISKLRNLLTKCTVPLAVRSSSVLEDHLTNPFAGVFRTFLIPNSSPDFEMRVEQLLQAIKLVYSSMFLKNARSYRESLNIPAREEKMAVIIQKVAGSKRGNYFYPLLSGVAQSYNYYPALNMSHKDGIVSLSTGLGKTAVERERTFAFCPAFPKLDLFPPEVIVQNNQRYFYAIDTNLKEVDLSSGEDSTLSRIRISQNLLENELDLLGSVWDYENKQFLNGKYIKGPRVITYRNILHYSEVPLASLLKDFLILGRELLGCEVEIEFAFDINSLTGKKHFYLLQIRPIAINAQLYSTDLENWLDKKDKLVLFSSYALGSASEEELNTIVYLLPQKFDIVKTELMAAELDELNQKIKPDKYLLIGPGRWGSSDRFLGIPVVWSQITNVATIVEVLLPDMSIEASQGSHFFHNLFSMNVAYLTVKDGTDYIAWDWLESLPSVFEGKFFKVKKTPQSLKILFDGKNAAIIR
jgi:hypothetical protein